MIMLKSTHEAKVAAATKKSDELAETRLQNNNGLRQLLNAANANCADFRVQIAALENGIADMQPDYQRGIARRLACEKDNAKRKAERAAK